MKFPTQHIYVADGHTGYTLHRDGAWTWRTATGTQGALSITHEVKHSSVADAKRELGVITSAR
jgi:hypothetical protein